MTDTLPPAPAPPTGDLPGLDGPRATPLPPPPDRSAEVAGGDVAAAFDGAAPRYDLMVALNPGYHRHLLSAATALAEQVPGPEPDSTAVRVVDLGCGSGASTRALLAALGGDRRVEITGVDASAGMLAVARDKSWPARVRFCHGRAEDLTRHRDGWGLRRRVDGVLAAYLFRNVASRDDVLAGVRDVLRPGGVLVVQEYSVAGSRGAALIWTLVCWLVVIPLSWLTSRETALYRYLWSSVLRFDAVTTFTDRLWRAGFVDVEIRTVPGWQRGILHTFRARVPS